MHPTRLITWNCQGAIRRKHSVIAALRPDILVIPECERPDGVQSELGMKPVRSVFWEGSNPNKGLGVISYGGFSVAVHEAYDSRFRFVVPLVVSGPVSFLLFAVWTVPDPATGSYVQALLEAYDHYRGIFENRTVLWAGDFNASVRFDAKLKGHLFGDFVTRAEADGVRSSYHHQRGCAHGDEPDNTFHLYRHEDKGHHIDYCFASTTVLENGFEVEVGRYDEWKSQSDHMPLICDLRLPVES